MREKYREGLWYVGLALAMPLGVVFLVAISRLI